MWKPRRIAPRSFPGRLSLTVPHWFVLLPLLVFYRENYPTIHRSCPGWSWNELSGTKKQHKVPTCNFHLITYIFISYWSTYKWGVWNSLSNSTKFLAYSPSTMTLPAQLHPVECLVIAQLIISIKNSIQVILQWDDEFWLKEWPLNVRYGKSALSRMVISKTLKTKKRKCM